MKQTFLLLCLIGGVRLFAEASSFIWGTPQIPLVAPQNDGDGVAPLQSFVIVPEDDVREPADGFGQYYGMTEATLGYPVDRTRQQYWIGDYLPPPSGTVDWEAMQAVSKQLEKDSICVYDPAQKRFYAAKGGSIEISWQMIAADGTTSEVVEQTYWVSNVGAGRPKRLFWTNPPYNSPIVTFENKFVKVFGANPIFEADAEFEDLATLEHGVYFFNNSASEQMLVAVQGDLDKHAALTGQIVIAYYDSGLYEKLLGLEVVEVTAPRPIECMAAIGEPLQPYGGGHDVVGLRGFPEHIAVTDERGEYYYQHKGINSYSPKNGNIYPLRPTESSSSRLVVWWKEYDEFGTAWPYECCRYTCDWGDNTITMVRGTSNGDSGVPLIAEGSVALSLQGFQEPEGHAIAPTGSFFQTQIITPGMDHYSLLKISEEDNVWFLPIRSIAHTDPRYFTQVADPINLAESCRPRFGSRMGTTEAYVPQVDDSLSGYLYAETSGTNYNPYLYYPPSTNPAATSDAQAYPSTIIPVNVSDKPLEVWWRNTWQPEDLGSPITYPTLAQWYRAQTPEANEAAQIVLASQLGSEMESRYVQGRAMRLDDEHAMLRLPQIRHFQSNRGTFDCRLRAPEQTTGQLLTVGNTKGAIFTLSLTDEGYLQATWGQNPAITSDVTIADNRWHHFTTSFTAETISFTIDGVTKTFATTHSVDDLSQVMLHSAIGTLPGSGIPAAVGAEIDSLTMWSKVMNQADLVDAERLDVTTEGLTFFVNFESEHDFADGYLKRHVQIQDQCSGMTLIGASICPVEPGAPRLASGLIYSETTPTLYVQNDPSAIGYNPNEEHALLTFADDGAAIAWAIRDDITVEGSSHGVLVSYTEGGEAKMRWYHVARTNETYPTLADTLYAGEPLLPPRPLDLLPNANNARNTWDAASEMPFRDRNQKLWARRDGPATLYFWYEVQPDFYLPEGNVGDLVPWLNTKLSGMPEPWTSTASWAKNVPELKIGQTLTTAINDLPEVWNMSSLLVTYPTTTSAIEKLVMLYDPTTRQTASLMTGDIATTEDFIQKSGLAVSDKITYRNGVYTFNYAPPSVGDRLTIDPNRDIDTALGLVGRKEDKAGTTNLLFLNCLTQTEMADLKNAFKDVTNNTEANTAFAAAIEKLANPIQPSELKAVTDKNGTHQAFYLPADHYALTAIGYDRETAADKGCYVTLIEADCTDDKIVNPAEQVAMHVIRVVPELYVAPLAVREDATNLLSQKLSVVYGEPFAGRATDFTFQWKRCLPSSNGVVPTDFENDYVNHKEGDAITDLVIGGNADDLEDMVNTYFAVRYRPKEKTDVADAIGTDWSDWSGPILAEGWIQRVLNNITPFTQQMVDLYTNEAETAVSMIQKAGGPYMGDVALNQDNLTNVGLIQLYMTLLNNAESLSISGDKANVATDAEVDQLVLAATRAADLYTVLGDEAYSDALNPTIGFGADFSVEDKNNLKLDYGALASSLFCFDNQVPTLLDEELALLRGRAADYQTEGLLQVAPYYNRLPWNFTRGMTGGEVAYAVNYNISGSQSSTVDVEEAAQLYPQGHGDAYGHYLSAVKLYYRLLRNSNFAWGESAMGEMLLGDAVLNVDYYDENRFAEIAGSLGKTALATFERTARKAYAENSGAPLAGYADQNPERGFGYGEWASKAGLGVLYNWAMGNALLPEAPHVSTFYQATWDGSSLQSGLSSELNAYCDTVKQTDPFTMEFQVIADAQQTLHLLSDGVTTQAPILLQWESPTKRLLLTLDQTLQLAVQVDKGDEGKSIPLCALSADTPTLIALSRETVGGEITLRVLTLDGTVLASATLEDGAMPAGTLTFAKGFKGIVNEFRYWAHYQSNEALIQNAATVSLQHESLVHYLRTFTREPQALTLADLATDATWQLAQVTWLTGDVTDLELPYEDQGLNQIDRSTATALTDLTGIMTQIESTLSRLDSGTNPLGLAEQTVPFDITPVGVESGTSSHFEQILQRAEVALKNADAVLNEAQTLGSRLRQLEDGRIAYEDALTSSEEEIERELIRLLGTPYTDDIGGTGLYAHGYTGPDYYHYMYMDLVAFGLDDSATSSQSKTYAVTYDISEVAGPTGGDFRTATNGCLTVQYTVSPNGFLQKPEDWTGTRAVTGEIQQAYGEALVDLVALREAINLVDRKKNVLDVTTTEVNKLVDKFQDAHTFREGVLATDMAYTTVRAIANAILDITAMSVNVKTANEKSDATILGTSTNLGGVQVQRSLSALGSLSLRFTANIYETVRLVLSTGEALLKQLDTGAKLLEHDSAAADRIYALRSEIAGSINAYTTAVEALAQASARVTASMDTFSSILAEAETLQKQRELMRQQAVNALTRMRYNDMFFRQVRNDALAKYEKSFEIAQRYTYLAAQAFEYETVSDLSDVRRTIIGTRALGTLAEDGSPLVQGAAGDGGLSNVLAMLKADWEVLKPRLGINNQQDYVTWFSLRRELCRIRPGSEGDTSWKEALSAYYVDDLRTHELYRRYCHPVTDSTEAVPEPALVIPFGTTVEFAKNFFGKGLAGGDSAFDASYFATRIAGAGIHFEGYSTEHDLAATPNVWLIPTGDDYFRKPGGNVDDVIAMTVVDQVVPLPYNVGKTELNDAAWQPAYDGDFGGADKGLRIRRYPAFRAAYGDSKPATSDVDALSSARLIGRSVWNDQWVLIIPFGSMHENRDVAKQNFIQTVKDIRIGLRTYSHAGN